MLNFLVPALLIALFPLDLVAGLLHRTYPTQATLMALGGALLGVYLARKLWGGGVQRLEATSRLRAVSQQGSAFDPASDEVQAHLDNARVNYLLGGGLILFGVFFTVCTIGSYLVVIPIEAQPSTLGQAVQLGIILLFTFLVWAVEAFGARIFLKR